MTGRRATPNTSAPAAEVHLRIRRLLLDAEVVAACGGMQSLESRLTAAIATRLAEQISQRSSLSASSDSTPDGHLANEIAARVAPAVLPQTSGARIGPGEKR